MNILFITDYWFPQKTTNAICVENIARELIAGKNKVYVSAYSGDSDCIDGIEYEHINFEFIKPSFARRLLNRSQQTKSIKLAKMYGSMGKSINRLRRMILLPFYPVVSFSLPLRWKRQVVSMIDREDINVIVSVNAPEESLYTGYLVKKKRPSIKWVIYNIDAGSNILPGTSFENLKAMLQSKAIHWENRLFNLSDKVIVMEGHSDYYKKSVEKDNASKLYIADVPLLRIRQEKLDAHTVTNSDIQKWVYTGNMNGAFYNPTAICQMFAEYSKYCYCELHLYGPSDHRDYLKEIAKTHQNIIWHGSVSHEDVDKAQREADVLVYYKCKKMDSISGKLYEYLTQGKPILFLGPTNDINSRKLARYFMGMSFDITLSPETNAALAYDFLKNHQKPVDNNLGMIKKQFNSSLPETTARILTEW